MISRMMDVDTWCSWRKKKERRGEVEDELRRMTSTTRYGMNRVFYGVHKYRFIISQIRKARRLFRDIAKIHNIKTPLENIGAMYTK